MKFQALKTLDIIPDVTPFVGVWIEMYCFFVFVNCWCLSLPSWECGLKSAPLSNWEDRQKSLPSWECGLKCKATEGMTDEQKVTPFVGVWIEIIRYFISRSIVYSSLPSWECGLKSVYPPMVILYHLRHSLRGSVD